MFANISNWPTLISQATQSQWEAVVNPRGYILLTMVILFASTVISAFFFSRSMALTAKKTGIGLFRTAGLVLLIGAILTIVLVGAVLLWISLPLIAIAFFKIQTRPTQPAAAH